MSSIMFSLSLVVSKVSPITSPSIESSLSSVALVVASMSFKPLIVAASLKVRFVVSRTPPSRRLFVISAFCLTFKFFEISTLSSKSAFCLNRASVLKFIL